MPQPKSQTEEDIAQNGLLYDCGHHHKSISEALSCKKETLNPMTPEQEIISKLLNQKLREYKRILSEQINARDNLKFNLEEAEQSVEYMLQTIAAVESTLKTLNLPIKE